MPLFWLSLALEAGILLGEYLDLRILAWVKVAGNDAGIAEDWICVLSALRHPPRLLETPHRSNVAHRPWHSTLPILWREAHRADQAVLHQQEAL